MWIWIFHFQPFNSPITKTITKGDPKITECVCVCAFTLRMHSIQQHFLHTTTKTINCEHVSCAVATTVPSFCHGSDSEKSHKHPSTQNDRNRIPKHKYKCTNITHTEYMHSNCANCQSQRRTIRGKETREKQERKKNSTQIYLVR